MIIALWLLALLIAAATLAAALPRAIKVVRPLLLPDVLPPDDCVAVADCNALPDEDRRAVRRALFVALAAAPPDARYLRAQARAFARAPSPEARRQLHADASAIWAAGASVEARGRL